MFVANKKQRWSITGRELDRETSEIYKQLISGDSLFEKIRYCMGEGIRMLVYRNAMHNIEDDMPKLYQFLTSTLGLPEPYGHEKMFEGDPRKFV